MKKLKVFISSLLLTTSPSLLVYPQTPQVIEHVETKDEPRPLLSYDEILHLLEEIESGEIEKRSSPEELVKINHFLALLAREGALPEESEENLTLEEDIEELLNERESLFEYAFSLAPFGDHLIFATTVNENGEIVLCKSWVDRQLKKAKKFIEKHKKAIIIGAAIAVAAAVVIVGIVAATSAAAAAAGAAAASDSDKSGSDKKEPASSPSAPSNETATEAPALKSAIDEQINSFKENLVKEEFLQPNRTAHEALSIEENGRALGALFAHESLKNLQKEMSENLILSQEIQSLGSQYPSLLEKNTTLDFGHPEIDRLFSTDYTPLFATPETDFTSLSYQVRGEKALSYGYYDQAVHDFGKVIELGPTNPLPYLERGIAHFNLGQYDRSLEDYRQFSSQSQKTNPLSVSEFSLGFAKGLPTGVYESGEGMLLFLADFVTHPIYTAEQIVDSVNKLVNLARNDEWEMIAEALSPEMYQLVTEWETLPSDKRGELAGYALGKHGTDIFAPGGLVKLASKSVKGAQELATVWKNIQIAHKTLVLEAAAEIGNTTKIAEIVETGQRSVQLADGLGFTSSEMGQLKKAGRLEEVVNNTLEDILKNPKLSESYKLFERAEAFLEPHGKKFMSESQIRDLIHQTGIRTFPRPVGIPENFRVRLSDGGAGILYVHPEHTHTSIRVMPGKPHSPNLNQQNAYVIYMRNGKALDKHGNIVNKKSPEAHIPLEEFVYRD